MFIYGLTRNIKWGFLWREERDLGFMKNEKVRFCRKFKGSDLVKVKGRFFLIFTIVKADFA